MPTRQPISSLINFPVVRTVAALMAPAGPRVVPSEQRKIVESLRYAATASVQHVFEITGLDVAHNLYDSEVRVVDRTGWTKANTQAFAVMLDPASDTGLGEKISDLSRTQRAVTSYAGSAELGGVLAYLSTRVLGQYEPYAALAGYGASGGRLLLVAPNIVKIERELNVEPHDFRLWVCLHEQTHRVQFAAAPWLRNYMLQLMQELAESMGGAENLTERILSAASAAKTSRVSEERRSGIDLMLDAEAREIISRITAAMSLLEGHANVVMDAVDSSIVPTVKTIRRRFNRRSETQKLFSQIAGRLLGMNKKLKQYKDGQKFVQFIVDTEGMERFNRIWETAENLPTEAELHHPQDWIDRVLGSVGESK